MHLVRKAAQAAIVLLKNDAQLLPLAQGTRVAVIGDFAETPRYQGAGSSNVHSIRVDHCPELPEVPAAWR